jgi:hypothetical protein
MLCHSDLHVSPPLHTLRPQANGVKPGLPTKKISLGKAQLLMLIMNKVKCLPQPVLVIY